jgi:hypothetical protein
MAAYGARTPRAPGSCRVCRLNDAGTLGYYVRDEREHGRVADLLLAEGIGDDRNTLTAALALAKPGQTLVFRYEEPEPDEPPTSTFSTADFAP